MRPSVMHLDSWRQLPELFGDGFRPLADVEETAGTYLVETELPGIRRDDVDIEIAGRRVTVRGERKEKERSGILRKRERIVGRFTCEVTLPGPVDEDAVEPISTRVSSPSACPSPQASGRAASRSAEGPEPLAPVGRPPAPQAPTVPGACSSISPPRSTISWHPCPRSRTSAVA